MMDDVDDDDGAVDADADDDDDEDDDAEDEKEEEEDEKEEEDFSSTIASSTPFPSVTRACCRNIRQQDRTMLSARRTASSLLAVMFRAIPA